ncbi:carboxypeptidase-like regulatory domain-containing protein [Aureispira anguillae]|uniref:Carboxypeptidase-like regulatory domain-containing protein n=1 Tax=Aureispira anguillae TaxID=2864201 RepID=A0A915YBW3_9BACT|nr:carboxypeptidase-like regulatory domain-containing protein [Aureispira anguillae]BDS10168.1 carboxypeptidase-like regulatory domain-containing protein [Aureispira anguillae]
MNTKYLLALLFGFFSFAIVAQEQSDIVEVYGLIVTKGENARYAYVPFVTVAVKGTTRGTYANYEGMYSIVVKKGQTLTFSAVGFEDREIVIPEDIDGMYHSLKVELMPASINIDEVTVFPWPDRDNLAAEFLAMQPNRAGQLEAIAKENLERNQLLAVANNTSMDGRENSIQYLRQQASDYSYQGQQAPQSIFDPIAWGKFFKQWKKKKHSAKEEQMIKILEGENQR